MAELTSPSLGVHKNLNPKAKEYYPSTTYFYLQNDNYHISPIIPTLCPPFYNPVPPASVQLPRQHFHTTTSYQYYPSDNITLQFNDFYYKNSTQSYHFNPTVPPVKEVGAGGGNGAVLRRRGGGRNFGGKRRVFCGRGSSSTGGNGNGGFGGDHQGHNGKSNYGDGKGSNSRGRVSTYTVERKIRREVMPVKSDGLETTVMIRNIPNQYTRGMLAKLLDEFCDSENQKCLKDATNFDETLADHPIVVAYDFLYLPIDFKTQANKGYAFVNFTNPIGVWKLHLAYNNKGWKHYSSSKICQIAYATIQGKEKLIEHFSKSRFVCNSEKYLPVCFSPPRDGSGLRVMETTIGERISLFSRSKSAAFEQRSVRV